MPLSQQFLQVSCGYSYSRMWLAFAVPASELLLQQTAVAGMKRGTPVTCRMSTAEVCGL